MRHALMKREAGATPLGTFRRSPRCCESDDAAFQPLCPSAREGAAKVEDKPEDRPEAS